MSVLFHNGSLKVRELEEGDKSHLARWLNDPAVLEFYEGRDNPHTLEMIEEHFYNRDRQVAACIIEWNGTLLGYIQFYPLDEEEREKYGYDSDISVYGTDQFIGEPDYWGKGIGKRVIQSMIDYLIEKKGADKVVMDPQIWNRRAIACYESCGLEKKKLIPRNEWHEGEWRDAWLMEYDKDKRREHA
jgi:aminoglycoside 6'-N-acetyltransferase